MADEMQDLVPPEKLAEVLTKDLPAMDASVALAAATADLAAKYPDVKKSEGPAYPGHMKVVTENGHFTGCALAFFANADEYIDGKHHELNERITKFFEDPARRECLQVSHVPTEYGVLVYYTVALEQDEIDFINQRAAIINQQLDEWREARYQRELESREAESKARARELELIEAGKRHESNCKKEKTP